MKKLSLFLTILMLFSIFAGCGSSETNKPEETEGNKRSDDEFVINVNLFADPKAAEDDSMMTYPQNKRQAVVDYMMAMAQFEWTTPRTFVLDDTYQGWSYHLEYNNRSTYYGIPFNGKTRGTLQAFRYYVDNGVYSGPMSVKDMPGNVCYDAVYAALVQFCPTVKYKDTADIFPQKGTGLSPLGEWNEAGAKDSSVIIANNTLEQMSEFYAMLDVGDIVAKHIVEKDAGHLRVVVEKPTVVRNAAGQIDPAASYVVCVEQTNAWDKVDIHTTWFVNHKYTFETLYNSSFVPLTVDDYADETSAKAVFGMEADLTSAEDLQTKKKFKGIVTSNYNILGLYFEITDESGAVAYKTAIFPNEKRIHLNKYEIKNFDYSSLAPGKYHVTFTGEIGVGTKLLTEYDFQK